MKRSSPFSCHDFHLIFTDYGWNVFPIQTLWEIFFFCPSNSKKKQSKQLTQSPNTSLSVRTSVQWLNTISLTGTTHAQKEQTHSLNTSTKKLDMVYIRDSRGRKGHQIKNKRLGNGPEAATCHVRIPSLSPNIYISKKSSF